MTMTRRAQSVPVRGADGSERGRKSLVLYASVKMLRDTKDLRRTHKAVTFCSPDPFVRITWVPISLCYASDPIAMEG